LEAEDLLPLTIKDYGRRWIKKSEGFAYLRQKYPRTSEAKMKEGIFVDAKIKQLFEDHDFIIKFNVTERRHRKAFETVCRKYLDNEKAENYSEIVQELISPYSATGVTCHHVIETSFSSFPCALFS
jgi:hypothetical protein